MNEVFWPDFVCFTVLVCRGPNTVLREHLSGQQLSGPVLHKQQGQQP